MTQNDILALLEGGNRRSIGRVHEVIATVLRNRALFPSLMEGWCSEDPVFRMRAADGTEKITRKYPEWLLPYKHELLNLMANDEQQEVRWHLRR